MSARMSNLVRIPQRQIGAQIFTDDMLHQIMTHSLPQKRAECLPHLITAMHEFDITNKYRAAAFLATIAVESGELRWFEEKGPKKNPETYFEKKYGYTTKVGRNLGNTQPGDGFKYRGRGAIQVTGRHNCEACLRALGLPAGRPEALAEVENVFRSAGWFWRLKNSKGEDLNSLADRRAFGEIQRRVNGTFPPNGWDDRKGAYERALAALPNGWVLTEAPMEPIDPPALTPPPYPLWPGTDPDEGSNVPSTVDLKKGMEVAGPYDPAVEVEAAAPAKERTTKSLVSTVTATLSSLGLTLGTLFTDGVNNLKDNPELVVLIALAMMAILVCYVVYQHRQTKLDLADRAHARDVTLETMKIRSDPGRFNVEVVPRAVPPDPATVEG